MFKNKVWTSLPLKSAGAWRRKNLYSDSNKKQRKGSFTPDRREMERNQKKSSVKQSSAAWTLPDQFLLSRKHSCEITRKELVTVCGRGMMDEFGQMSSIMTCSIRIRAAAHRRHDYNTLSLSFFLCVFVSLSLFLTHSIALFWHWRLLP